ncbi:sensory rhodopsin transducer [Salibacterium aidingense]|uniref:sensory rhodopsin transducer n=1 Tax=Salibacterium aidingense TaxID=384933 RepID=UPI00040C2046|nr:sensory rhodopsin transducer [Salibacterium aidingense]
MSIKGKGDTHWIIPDGFIPPESSGSQTSHESICVLNLQQEPAQLKVTIYFEDQEPLEEIEVQVKGKRTSHIKTALLEKDGRTIPKSVPYAIEVESDRPVIVQYSRLDSTQPELALMSTMAHPLNT